MPKVNGFTAMAEYLEFVFNTSIEKNIEAYEDALRKTTIKTWGDIIKMTPVDTGRARANWFIDTQPSDKTTYDKKAKTGAYVARELPKPLVGQKVYLYNNIPYIRRLEYGGHSDQAPVGMVRVSLIKFERILERKFKRELKKRGRL